MLNIALFGPPGAGKGTQAEFLINRYKLIYISTGELLRQEIAAKSYLGLQAEKIIVSGGLVSDEIIVQLIEKSITDNPKANGFLFDGFPRTWVQAYILEGLMIKLNTSLTCLINLKLPVEESIARLMKRGETSGRSDDNESVIRTRLSEYYEKTLPIQQFFQGRGVYHEIDAGQNVEAVNRSVSEIIQTIVSKRLFNIVLFGYPGSGRGTQAEHLAEKFGLEYVATGKMLQQEIKNETELGEQIGDLYESGQLVPDEIVVKLIEKKLENHNNIRGFIFKGFPRTFVQAYILDGLLKKHHSRVSQIIELKVPTIELINRLNARSKTENCMPYDRSTARIVKRLQEHEEKTVPVVDKYKHNRRVIRIDGRGSFEEVAARTVAEVEQGMRNLF